VRRKADVRPTHLRGRFAKKPRVAATLRRKLQARSGGMAYLQRIDRRHAWRWSAIVAGAVFLSACASVSPLTCSTGASAQLKAELLFGRNIGNRLGVSEDDFRRFLAAEVTPRFPDGLTVIDGRGQYRDGTTGRIVREPSKILVLIIRDEQAEREKLSAIAEAYKTRFRQQSVGTVIRPVCASF
jgi:Protein of unknown function (DUF3574)